MAAATRGPARARVASMRSAKLAGSHQRVLAARQVRLGQHRTLQPGRLHLGFSQPRSVACGGRPVLPAAAARHRQHLRKRSRQTLFCGVSAGRLGAGRLQQRQRGEHGVVLRGLRAEQAERDARAGIEGGTALGQRGLRE